MVEDVLSLLGITMMLFGGTGLLLAVTGLAVIILDELIVSWRSRRSAATKSSKSLD